MRDGAVEEEVNDMQEVRGSNTCQAGENTKFAVKKTNFSPLILHMFAIFSRPGCQYLFLLLFLFYFVESFIKFIRVYSFMYFFILNVNINLQITSLSSPLFYFTFVNTSKKIVIVVAV